MDQEADDGFYALVESLLDDTFNVASLVPRVAKHKEFTDYLSDVEEVRCTNSKSTSHSNYDVFRLPSCLT